MRPSVVVLDYGSGNLRSAQRAVERAGAEVEVTADPARAIAAAGLVLPGVGAFAACRAGLRAAGGDDVVAERIARERPVLGICVGMQVLFETGEEHGVATAGLGVFPGRVERLGARILPHMGWNTVAAANGSAFFAGAAADTRYYFVHSYGVGVGDRRLEAARVSTTRHGSDFVAAVETPLVSATQFHPEKSGAAGAALLTNWLGTL
ncbi:MAG: imidazole glycerol phosphate synthase subunit HisH [Actinomycetota bacterium]|nr:imidazole glycerol phosphate synthase subunit HisH [Actinomycetota bacterium]